MRIIIGVMILFLSGGIAFADAMYNSQRNYVMLSTPILSPVTAWITIFNEEHIQFNAIGDSIDKDKTIGLCGKEPTLGLLLVDGEPIPNTPSVTEVGAWSDAPHESSAAGWVPHFVLKGEDARDLMDILYTYESFAFIIPTGTACEETQLLGHGTLNLQFNTRGLERAMKRLQ